MTILKNKERKNFLILNTRNTAQAHCHADFTALEGLRDQKLHKRWSFSLKISSLILTTSAENCGFGPIYLKNPQWKTSFFVCD